MNANENANNVQWLLLLFLLAMSGVQLEDLKAREEEQKQIEENISKCPNRYTVQDMNATIPYCRLTNEICNGCDRVGGQLKSIFPELCEELNKEQRDINNIFGGIL